MKNTTYDNLKMIALIVAPIMTFIATILKIWNVPYSTQILSTLSASSKHSAITPASWIAIFAP